MRSCICRVARLGGEPWSSTDLCRQRVATCAAHFHLKNVWRLFLATPSGYDPLRTVRQTVMLPLHQGAVISFEKRILYESRYIVNHYSRMILDLGRDRFVEQESNLR